MRHPLFMILGIAATVVLFASPQARAVDVEVRFDYGDGDAPLAGTIYDAQIPNSAASDPPQQVMDLVILSPTRPKAAVEASAIEQADDQAVLETGRALQLPNYLGGSLTYEHISWQGQGGNLYGLSGAYEREMGPFAVGAILTYKYFDYDVSEFDPFSNRTAEFDLSSNRVGGIFYGKYFVLEDPVILMVGANGQVNYSIYNDPTIDNFVAFGGGAFCSVGGMVGPVELTGAFSYSYSKMDVAFIQNFAHLIKFGGMAGIGIGSRFAVDLYVLDTQNLSDYVEEITGMNYVTIGVEGGFQPAGSWSLTLGYKTILALADYSSNEVYLGTLWKF